jgi:septum site-determining protein MinD
MTGTLLAVAGGKGGCGKTTTTLGLARAAADRDRRVLAVDADAEMPNLHRLAGVARTPGLGDGQPTSVARRWPDDGRVRVVPAPTDGGVEPPALTRCRGAADLALLDCPAGAGRDAADPLRVADAAVLVTTPSPTCLRDTARTAAMAEALGTPVAGVVVSRADRPPEGLASLLSAPPVAAVPAVRAPLSAPAAREAYARGLAAIESGPSAPDSSAGRRPPGF